MAPDPPVGNPRMKTFGAGTRVPPKNGRSTSETPMIRVDVTLGRASLSLRVTFRPGVKLPMPVSSGSPFVPLSAKPSSFHWQSVGVNPNACEAVQPQSQFRSGVKAPRYRDEE